ncbi:MAG: DEAD/DEAH box helicase [Spirochaetes bacterium]|nr:DEAD/DEAH box helicase [Spirochaetota bacterium]
MNNGFSNLNISKELIQILSKNRINEPTPVQQQAIPVLLEGKDTIALAQTGTGKTLAFLLPIMQQIKPSEKYVQALIISPTRELALQITNVARMLSQANGINILAAYGGQDFNQQKKKLKNSVHLVIGTPGRLLDHIQRKSVNFTRINTLVLDEADQMLDMGFQRDVEQIFHNTARNKQTVLFSATMPPGIAALAEKYLNSPSRIHAPGKKVTLENIRQIAVETNDKNKQEMLCSMIKEHKPFMAIIFCRTKRRAQSLNKMLNIKNYKSSELHGNLTQAQREKSMKAFRETKVQFLVATDIAARGIDVEGITHIFNFDIPANTENYIHRIGRTGRAGNEGTAITFFTHSDRKELSSIERGIKSAIEIIPDKNMRIFQHAVPSGIAAVQNTAKKQYSSKSGGYTGSSYKKSAGKRKPYPVNNSSRHDELTGSKEYSFGEKSREPRPNEKRYSGKNNYKYSDTLPEYGSNRKKTDTYKQFSGESGNTGKKAAVYKTSSNSNPRVKDRMNKNSIFSILKNERKKLSSAENDTGR